jgi:hypothetical protein
MEDDQANDGDVTGGGMRVGAVAVAVIKVSSIEPELGLAIFVG